MNKKLTTIDQLPQFYTDIKYEISVISLQESMTITSTWISK